MTETDTQTLSPSDLAQINALMVKHHAEIDRFKALEPQQQMECFRQLGVDPVAIENHYKGFIEKADALTQQDKAVSKKMTVVGWVSFAAGFGGMLAWGKKFSESLIVRAIVTPLAGGATWLAGTFVGSRVLAGKIRQESKQLNIDARDALIREFAIALENKQQQTAAPASPALPEPVRADVPQRDPSFAAQALAEKAAVANATPERA